MKKNKNILTALIVVGILVIYAVSFTVAEGKTAVLTVFGKANEQSYAPGLYFKPPWPFSEVHMIDARSHTYEGMEGQVLTSDKQSFIVKSHVIWRVIPEEVQTFWKNVRQAKGTGADSNNLVKSFEVHLGSLLESHQNSKFGQKKLEDLFPQGKSKDGVALLEKELLEALAKDCREQYGVEVLLVGFNKIVLTESVMQKVYDKMTAERNQESENLKAEGEAEAKKILAEAQSKFDQALAKVSGEVKEILGKAEVESQQSYKILAQESDLYLKLKKIEALEKMLKERSTLIVDPNVLPLDILKKP